MLISLIELDSKIKSKSELEIKTELFPLDFSISEESHKQVLTPRVVTGALQ